MTIRTVAVTYERKFNLGDYNSVHIGVTLHADLDDTDGNDAVAIGLELQATARDLVKAERSRLPARQD